MDFTPPAASRLLQQLALPVHQVRCVLSPVAREVAERGFAGDERGINGQFARVRVADFFKVAEPAEFRFAGPLRMMADDGGKFFRRHGGTRFDGFHQGIAAARVHAGRHQRIHGLFRGHRHGDPDHGLVRQNKKRRTVGGNGLFFAPVPEFAENGEFGAVKMGTAFDAPDGFLVHDDASRFLAMSSAFNLSASGLR